MYAHEYDRDWELWRFDRREDAYIICQRLLADPVFGEWHQAGFHLLLGHLDDLYVEHAQRARDMYNTIYDTSETLPTPEETATQEKYLKLTEEVPGAAQEDPGRGEEDEGGEDEDNTVASGDELVIEITRRADVVIYSDERKSGCDDVDDNGYARQVIDPDEWESGCDDELDNDRAGRIITRDEWEPVANDDEVGGYTGRVISPDEWQSVSGDDVNEELEDVKENEKSHQKSDKKYVEDPKTDV
ncbi:hypothetical protein BKA63DRAFT_149940 [Paraphoma chrysanthemicola]|nr:hypothetical protein BKA63DRAFT_149940 [Paraphoma chrysanthemicola]